MPAATITFPGITQILGVEYTLSRGATPSIATLTMLPQTTLTLGIGDLVISYGGNTITLLNMVPDVAHLRRVETSKGWRWNLNLLDRRFFWQRKVISGTYNVRSSDGTITNQKSAKQLANLLLDALGETGYDTSLMPTTVYPLAVWNAGNAGRLLADLMDLTCCEICLQSSGGIVIYPLGTGGTLAASGTSITPPYALTAGTVPTDITLYGGPTNFQSKLTLEATAVGTNSVIDAIDSTDFKPAAGWGTDWYQFFPNVSSANRPYAFFSMYKWFRPSSQAQGGLTVPGCSETITSATQYLLSPTPLGTLSDTSSHTFLAYPALEGTYWPQGDLPSNTAANTNYTGKFTISNQFVQTEYPVIKWSTGTPAVEAPVLYLTTAYNVKKANSLDLVAYTRTLSVGGLGGSLVLHRPELFTYYRTSYSGTSVTSTTDNTTAINAEADAYLALFAAKYVDAQCLDMEYLGLLSINPDGLIAQVRWRAGYGMPPTTRASKNFEFDKFNIGVEERRRRELVAQLGERVR